MEEQEKLLQTVNYGSGLDDKKMKYHGRYQKRDLALIMLLLDTGMRVSELHGIDLKDLDLDNCSVIVTRKGGNVATLYYSDEVRNLLQDYIDERKSKFPHIGAEEPLFVTLQGNRLAVRSIETLVKKYAVTALPGKGYLISPHKMRSSFAMELYGETRDILLLQKKLGHTNITATNIYAKASNKDMEDSRNILQQKRQNRE
jgi:site-specific recombinase XerD